MKKGEKVHWQWGRSEAEGTIVKKFTNDAEITSKGKRVKRKASSDEPAYAIKQESGAKVLKSESELKKGSK